MTLLYTAIFNISYCQSSPFVIISRNCPGYRKTELKIARKYTPIVSPNEIPQEPNTPITS